MNQTLIMSTLKSPLSSLINLTILTFFLLVRETFCAVDPQFQACSVTKNCGDGLNISFPFYIEHQQNPYCGFPGFNLSCNKDGHPILKLSDNDYIIHHIFYQNQSLRVSNAAFSNRNSDCYTPIQNISLPSDRFNLEPNQTDHVMFLYNCNPSLFENISEYNFGCSRDNENGSVLALLEHDKKLDYAEKRCKTRVVVPVEAHGRERYRTDEEMLESGFMLKWMASDCSVCEASGGKCGFENTTYHFKCYCPDRPHAWHCTPRKDNLGLKLALGIGCPAILIICLVFYFRRRYKQRYAAANLLSRNISSDPSTKSDLEGGSVYFGVPIFSYRELDEATNNFDHAKELGDGGFGAVYHGKLRDGREVAVKRLYEHNYRRLEQFMNEVQILTRLRHKNLVSLYGCTSPSSHELLLVYEYIPNGTIADHLHSDGAKPGSLTWPIRMSVAIETATALAYLHASDIVHRDVKTTNILLDNNFCVKVADFGLSRLFPTDVTHVSTAPQGTPGYVDPEYYQCYQLTTKSDVYSFGVVLIELISSMPAVDISRHRHEINLSNLAIIKIQKRAFNELVDPSLGFDSDLTIRRMIMLVAELAYQCLQLDKELRPSMEEVLETLKNIEKGNYEWENSKEADDETGELKSVQPSPSPDCDEVGLLKNLRAPPSPDSVTDKWFSSATTPNASG